MDFRRLSPDANASAVKPGAPALGVLRLQRLVGLLQLADLAGQLVARCAQRLCRALLCGAQQANKQGCQREYEEARHGRYLCSQRIRIISPFLMALADAGTLSDAEATNGGPRPIAHKPA